MSRYLWLLDNGHGEDTPGKRSPDWGGGLVLEEWEFTRDIVSRLKELLRWDAIEHEVLVPEDWDVPLAERVRRVNENAQVRRCILVSVHANAGGGRGIEVFTSPGATVSDRAASRFYEAYDAVFPEVSRREDLVDGDRDKEARFTLLTDTVTPAVLTENFFMDTEKECIKYLLTDEGRHLIALAHFMAVRKIESKGLEV